jgi:hypothetical protein
MPGRFGRDHRGVRKRSKHPVLKSVVTIFFVLGFSNGRSRGVLATLSEAGSPRRFADGRLF